MRLDDVRDLTLVRISDFPIRYDVRIQLDGSSASVFITGDEGDSAETVLNRAIAYAYRVREVVAP